MKQGKTGVWFAWSLIVVAAQMVIHRAKPGYGKMILQHPSVVEHVFQIKEDKATLTKDLRTGTGDGAGAVADLKTCFLQSPWFHVP